MLLTILTAWLLLSVPLAVFIGKCMAVGIGDAERATFRQLELALTTSESEDRPVAA